MWKLRLYNIKGLAQIPKLGHRPFCLRGGGRTWVDMVPLSLVSFSITCCPWYLGGNLENLTVAHPRPWGSLALGPQGQPLVPSPGAFSRPRPYLVFSGKQTSLPSRLLCSCSPTHWALLHEPLWAPCGAPDECHQHQWKEGPSWAVMLTWPTSPHSHRNLVGRVQGAHFLTHSPDIHPKKGDDPCLSQPLFWMELVGTTDSTAQTACCFPGRLGCVSTQDDFRAQGLSSRFQKADACQGSRWVFKWKAIWAVKPSKDMEESSMHISKWMKPIQKSYRLERF